jgi:hypothetical protein
MKNIERKLIAPLPHHATTTPLTQPYTQEKQTQVKSQNENGCSRSREYTITLSHNMCSTSGERERRCSRVVVMLVKKKCVTTPFFPLISKVWIQSVLHSEGERGGE